VAGVYLALQLLWVGRSVFLISFLAVLFGLCISAGADYLAQLSVPRGLAAVLIVLATIALLAALGASSRRRSRRWAGSYSSWSSRCTSRWIRSSITAGSCTSSPTRCARAPARC